MSRIRLLWARFLWWLAAGDNETWEGTPSRPFCSDCPDHEACAQGAPCRVVKRGQG